LEAEGDPDWPQFLVDLARLEWVIYEVFDGPGMEERAPLTTDALLDLEISQWPQVCLRPVPCLRLLETRFPVNDYFTVASRSAEGAVSAWREPEASFTVVTRRNYIVRRYTLTEEEHLLLSRLVAGEPIGLAVEALASATLADEETLATRLNVWLRNWTAEGFFESVFFKEQP